MTNGSFVCVHSCRNGSHSWSALWLCVLVFLFVFTYLRVCACLWCVRACVLCLVSSCASTVHTLLVIDNLPLFHFSSFNCLWVFLQESLDLVYLFVNKEFNECSRRVASSVLHVSASALFWLLYLVTVPSSNLLWWKMKFWFDIFVKCVVISFEQIS